jgi:hypothetical protein
MSSEQRTARETLKNAIGTARTVRRFFSDVVYARELHALDVVIKAADAALRAAPAPEGETPSVEAKTDTFSLPIARFRLNVPYRREDGLPPIETTHNCLYTQAKPCKELSDDPNQWCGFCGGIDTAEPIAPASPGPTPDGCVEYSDQSTQSWAVSVERDGENIVTIASNCLGGRDLSAEDERVIRMAAEHLNAFVGPGPTPEGRETAQAGSKPAQLGMCRTGFPHFCANCGNTITDPAPQAIRAAKAETLREVLTLMKEVHRGDICDWGDCVTAIEAKLAALTGGTEETPHEQS